MTDLITLRPAAPSIPAILDGRVKTTKNQTATLSDQEVLNGFVEITASVEITLPVASVTNAGADLYVTSTVEGAKLICAAGFGGGGTIFDRVKMAPYESCHVYSDGDEWYLIDCGANCRGRNLEETFLALPGLVAYWPLDDGSGMIARDLGPNDLPITLTGTVWQADAFLNTAVPYFDGLNDYGHRPGDDTELDLVNSFSFLALVRPTSANIGWIVSKYNTTGNQRSWGIRISASTTAQLTVSSDGTFSPPTTAEEISFPIPGLGAWFLLAVSYDYDAGAGTARVQAWNNAARVLDTTTTIAPLFNSTQPLELGRAVNVYLEGYIAHAAITSLGDIGPYVANIARLMGVA